MGDNESQVKIKIVTTADSSGVEQTRSQYDELFNDLKAGVADALKGEGVDTKFISHVIDEFDRLNAVLHETGASGDEVAQKIAKLEQNLQAAAAAEMKRVQQLKTNFEMALHEKDVKEEEEANQRRRRQEDQLWMEAEGRRLQENTEKLEQEIMARLKNERLAREATENTKQLGTAMQGTRRDIGSALLVGAQFVDDMQYGLRGIMNQIPQMAAAFGLGASVAGVIGIAAVAVNLLWDKFGGAKDAKAETDLVTESVNDMNDALKRAGEAVTEAFQKDLSKYTAEVERGTKGWQQTTSEIQRILGYHNQLAAVQTKIANSQLEIQRQNALAEAKTEEERKAINAKFEARKAAVNDASNIELAKRNLDAEQAQAEMLKKQNSNVSGLKDDAEGKIGEADREQKAFNDQYAGQSDQARRVQEAEAANQKLKQLQEQKRKDDEFNQARPATTSADAMARADKSRRLQDEIDAAAKDRDIKNTGVSGDKAALESGKGLKFSKLEEDAAKAAKEGADNAAALAKLAEQAKQRQQEIDAKREAAEKALATATEALAKIRDAQAESERQIKLKKLELQAAELKDSEDFAKAGAAATAAEKEAQEKQRQKEREEQIRKLENDAAEMEKNNLDHGAASKRNEAAKLKLGEDATPEQKRQLEREAKARMDEATQKTLERTNKNEARDAGNKLSNLGSNLGEAGKDLKEAADKLKDGATEKELEAVAAELKGLAPVLKQRFAGQEAKFGEILKELQTLKSQIANQRGGASS